MDFLGVGPLELLFIFLLALIVLGPKDMVRTGRTLGKFLNRVVKSPTWQTIKQTSREMRYLPNKLMREAGMEEEIKEFGEISRDVQELKRISTPFSLNEVGNEIQVRDDKEPSHDLSAWTTAPPDQTSMIPSPEPPVQNTTPESNNSETNGASDPQTSKTSSIEAELS